MAYLGHLQGPKMSDILKRRIDELSKLVKYKGPGDINAPPKTIQNLIAEEEKKEMQGAVVPVNIPIGKSARLDEFLYHNYDLNTDCGIDFYYTLEEDERKLLGESYSKKETEVMSAQETRDYYSWRDEVMSQGDFPLFG